MNKKEAIEMLKQCLEEIPHLKELQYDNREYQLWHDKVEQIIKSSLSPDDLETLWSTNLGIPVIDSRTPNAVRQNYYLKRLDEYGVNIEKIIQKYKILGIEEEPADTVGILPKAFIAHGGKSEALDKLKNFLLALGIEPLIVEEQPSGGRSIGENVDWYARQADCAIILATKGDIDGKTGRFIPRGNVLIEIGKSQELFEDRIIYLLQAGTKFPTNITEKVRERFTSQNMDKAFIKVAKELRNWGFITTRKIKE